jgi:AraC-like DNA-binding protein
MVQQSCDFAGRPQLKLDEWAALLRSTYGGDCRVVEPNAFAGWMRQLSVYGVAASAVKIQCVPAVVDQGSDPYRFDRTRRDIHVADMDWYCASFLVAGRCAMTQNEHTVQLAVGDVGLFDGARPATVLTGNSAQWFSIFLPRQPLISHLGFEPQACLRGRGDTLAARVLRQLVLDGIEDDKCRAPRSEPHMRLALYDLVSALFAPSEPSFGSRHSDALFKRIRGIIEDGFADPDFGPHEVAAEAGISLRYLQKLFTERSSTCSEFIYALRLDHAARLLNRRASLRTNQPLNEIAYVCGFREYTHFARKFRHRFGHTPGAHSGALDGAGDRVVRAHTGESAP